MGKELAVNYNKNSRPLLWRYWRDESEEDISIPLYTRGATLIAFHTP